MHVAHQGPAPATASTSLFPYPALPQEIFVQLVSRADKLATLHAMACTCKVWNRSTKPVFDLFKLGLVSKPSKLEEKIQGQLPSISSSQLTLFVLDYIASQMGGHKRQFRPTELLEFLPRVLKLLQGMESQQRTDWVKSRFHVLKGLSVNDWTQLQDLVKNEFSNPLQMSAFKTTVCSHPNADQIFFFPEDLKDARAQFNSEAKDTYIGMAKACVNNNFLIDGLYRTALQKKDPSSAAADVGNIVWHAKPSSDLLLYWLELRDQPVPVIEELLKGLLRSRLPAGCEHLVSNRLSECVSESKNAPHDLIYIACEIPANIVAVAKASKMNLCFLIHNVSKFKDEGKEYAKQFLKILKENKVVTQKEIDMWKKN